MSEEELYKLALSDVPNYSLLNEIFAIRDKRFPNEENDYTIKVCGSISLDVLNKYIKVVQENSQLKERIEKAIEYIEDTHVSVTQCEIGTGLLNTKDYLLEILKGDE